MTTTTTKELYKGNSRTFEIEIKDLLGVPIDISGATLKFSVRVTELGSTLIFKSTANTIELKITAPLVGKAEVYLIPSDTINLKAGAYLFDVQLTLANYKVYTVIKGTLNLIEPITK